MSNPLITIGICCFNAIETIDRAVQSALDQEYKDTEIIIIDDASNDGSRAFLCENYAEHRKIKLLQNDQNSGVAVTRNRIIDEARGDYLAFFDDDDVSDTTRITKQLEALSSFERDHANRTAICHTARKQIFPDGSSRIEMVPGINHDVPFPSGEQMAARILFGKPAINGSGSMATCSQMANIEVYKTLRFDPGFTRSEDTDLAVRHSLNNGAFIGLSEPLVTQTMTYGDEKTLTVERKMMRALLEKHKDFITAHYKFSFAQDWLAAKFLYLDGQKFRFLWALMTLFFKAPILTLQRLKWALPQRALNQKTRAFHGGTS